MSIIRELKGLNVLSGQLRQIEDIFERPIKALREAVGIGLPIWDPPEERPPSPPDFATVARVQEVIAMGTVEERRTFNKVLETFRKVRQGEPREEPSAPPPPGPPPGPPTRRLSPPPSERPS